MPAFTQLKLASADVFTSCFVLETTPYTQLVRALGPSRHRRSTMGATNWNKLTVVLLKEKLKGLDLPTTGKKADLVERLAEWEDSQVSAWLAIKRVRC